MSDSRIYTNADEVIVDYLKDIRDQLAALNKKLDALTYKPRYDPSDIHLKIVTGGTANG